VRNPNTEPTHNNTVSFRHSYDQSGFPYHQAEVRAGISKARLWLSMQSTYDLWQAEHREQPQIKRFARID
jgi:hypothetical protein